MNEGVELLLTIVLLAIVIPFSFIINTKIENGMDRDSFSFVGIDNNVSIGIYDSEKEEEMSSIKNVIYVKGNVPYQCNNGIGIECLGEIKKIGGKYNGKNF